MSKPSSVASLLLIAAVVLSASASAQTPPDGAASPSPSPSPSPTPAPAPVPGPSSRSSYLIVHGDLLRSFGGLDAGVGGGLEFGSFQNNFVAAGTVLTFDRQGPGTRLPAALYFGGGFSFHVPLGEHVLLIPGFNLGYRLVDSVAGIGGGIAAFAQLGAAYRFQQFYAGVEVQRPVYLELPTQKSAFFPNMTTGGAFLGLYF